MAGQKVSVKINTGDHEDLYFKEQEQKKIRMLREKAEQESNKKYKDEHKNHCFRCGTHSLAEINYESVKVDVCINDKCGAMHLDPGELEMIMKDKGGLDKIRKAVFSVFK